MTQLSAAAQSVLANLGYRVEVGDKAYAACYLRAGTAPPVAWVREDTTGWFVAIAKHMVPRLANDSLMEVTAHRHRPDDAAFVVAVPDRDRLYGVFELIEAACARTSTQIPVVVAQTSATGEPFAASMLLTTLDSLLDDAEAGHTQPSTVVRVLRDVRVGQDQFRAALLDYWGHACAVTNLDITRLLRASHCKPWRSCSDRERLDPNNGLLLAAHLDAAFDAGYISFADDGAMLFSPQLGANAEQVLGLRAGLRLRRMESLHGPYLKWHRENVFLSGSSSLIRASQ